MSSMFYPYTTPLVMNDITYAEYGGQTGTATVAQRQNAYSIAEFQTSYWLGAMLTDTIITGEHPWYGREQPIQLDWGRVRSVDGVQFIHINTCQQQETLYSGIGYVKEADTGLVNVYQTQGALCSCLSGQGFPYKVQIAYTSGFATGTVSSMPIMLQALTSASTLVLNEMTAPGVHEGWVGIQEFSSMRYSEVRKELRQTPFGASATAQYISTLLNQWRVVPALRL